MSALHKLSPERQQVVRSRVRELLGRSQGFRDLPAAERTKLAKNLVDTVAFLADPAAGQADVDPDQAVPSATGEAMAQAQAQAAPVRNPGQVGSNFRAGAVREGTDAFRRMVGAVDFPEFVSGLIEGVFDSIVDASIKQMEAYGNLLANVVKSVGQFADDNITPNQARDYVRDRFPDKLSISGLGGSPRLSLTERGEDSGIDDIKQAFGIEGSIDFDDEDSEAQLVRQAQLEMARLRQKQLATMVLMGINRIVVTDGMINAKVIFDMQASDSAEREFTASSMDRQRQDSSHSNKRRAGWFSRNSSAGRRSNRHVAVVKSAVEDESESKAEAKAKLSGEVRVNFRSETFPLDQMASQTEIDSVGDRARTGGGSQ